MITMLSGQGHHSSMGHPTLRYCPNDDGNLAPEGQYTCHDCWDRLPAVLRIRLIRARMNFPNDPYGYFAATVEVREFLTGHRERVGT